MMISLDILPGMRHLEQAFAFSLSSEHLEGLHSDSFVQTVRGLKDSKFETVPKILIIHLKRFAVDPIDYHSVKIFQTLSYPLLLTLDSSFMAHKHVTPSLRDRQYSLISVIGHHGEDAYSGHYTVDCRSSPAESKWFNFDDSTITPISETHALSSTTSAYILFYQQCSTF